MSGHERSLFPVTASVLKSIQACAIAIAASFLCILGFSFVSTQTPQSRIEAVVREANDANQLDPYSNINNDMFTECGILTAELVRNNSASRDMTGTVLMATPGHPCDVLRLYFAGKAKDTYTLFRYYYGARHLFAVLARFMSFDAMRSLMGFLGIAVPLALFAAFFFRARSELLAMSPLLLVLLAGFDYSNMGRNIAHAPGFVFPLLMLAGVVFCRDFFTPIPRRFGAYAAIASITTCFDTLSGPLPFILAVTLVVNHFAFNAKRRDNGWISQAAGLCVLFFAAAAMIIGLRLALVYVVFDINPLGDFSRELAFRMSSVDENSVSIARRQVFERLWEGRAISFWGSPAAATLFYIAGALSWCAALILLFMRRGERYREILLLGISSAVIAIWYVVFVDHTYIHYQFMGRIGVLPAAAGIMALVVLSKGWMAIPGIAVVPIVGLIALVQFQVVPPRIVEVIRETRVPVDAASCSNETALQPDGKPDIVWRIVLSGSRFWRPRLTGVTVNRITPWGVFRTQPGSFPVAVLSVDGRLLSGANRGVHIAIGRRQELLVSICDDGGATPQTQYSITAMTTQGDLSANEAGQ